MSGPPLKARVRDALIEHGIVPSTDQTPAQLRDRLRDAYIEEVRALREARRAGAIPLRDFATRADELKRRYPLLSLPLDMWT